MTILYLTVVWTPTRISTTLWSTRRNMMSSVNGAHADANHTIVFNLNESLVNHRGDTGDARRLSRHNRHRHHHRWREEKIQRCRTSKAIAPRSHPAALIVRTNATNGGIKKLSFRIFRSSSPTQYAKNPAITLPGNLGTTL